jgi:hypothetical protein
VDYRSGSECQSQDAIRGYCTSESRLVREADQLRDSTTLHALISRMQRRS